MLTVLLAVGLGSIFQPDAENDEAFRDARATLEDKIKDLDRMDEDDDGCSSKFCFANSGPFQNQASPTAQDAAEFHDQLAQQIITDVKGKIQDLEISLIEVKEIIRGLSLKVSQIDGQEEEEEEEEAPPKDEKDVIPDIPDSDKEISAESTLVPPAQIASAASEEKVKPCKRSSFWRCLGKCFVVKRKSRKQSGPNKKQKSTQSRGKMMNSGLSTESEMSSEHRLSFLDRFSCKTTSDLNQLHLSFLDSLDRKDDEARPAQANSVQLEEILAKIPDFRDDL